MSKTTLATGPKYALVRALLLSVTLLLIPAWAHAAVEQKSIEIEVEDSSIPNVLSYKLNIAYLEANPDQTRTIIFIHGNSASKEFFTSLLNDEQLQHYRLIAIDLPGHGASSNFPDVLRAWFASDENRIFSHHKHFYTFPGYAHVANQFLTAINLPPEHTYLFGWSLGGHVAIDMVAENPAIAKAIVTGTPIADFGQTAARFTVLRDISPPSRAFPDGTTVFDLLSFRHPFVREQAIAFHELGGVPERALESEVTASEEYSVF